MKNLSLALIFALTTSSLAFADQTWTVTSKGKEKNPIAYEDIQKVVAGGVTGYKAFDNTIGEMKSWECKVVQKSIGAGMRTYIDTCVATLDLPADWDWYGSFKLSLGFDPINAKVTSLNYEWSKN